MRRRQRAAMCAATVLALALPGAAAAQAGATAVALSGQTAPGTNRPFGLLRTPVINDAGQLLFGASAEETYSSREGLWVGAPGALRLLVTNRDRAPDGGEDNFEFLYDSLIDAAGNVLLVTTTGQHTSGLWHGPPGGLRVLAYQSEAAPGFPAGWAIGGPDNVFPRLSPTGTAGFPAWLRGPESEGSYAVYVGTPGALRVVARNGDPAPGMPGTTFNFGPITPLRGTPSIDRAGRVAFSARVDTPVAPGATIDGVWAGTPGALQLVARQGGAAHGAAGATFGEMDPYGPGPRIAGGVVTFAASLAGPGVTAANDRGVWSGPAGALQLAAREGDPVAGGTAGLLYGDIESGLAAANTSGRLTFAGDLAGAGVTPANDRAVFFGRPGDVRVFAREGAIAAGAGGATFTDFDAPSINEAGMLAFAAVLGGPGVTGANDRGIWASDPAGQLIKIAREGDLLDVGGGSLRTIATLDVVPGGAAGEDAFASALNNAGQVAFRATFTDGSSGVFVVAVPEPATLAAFAAVAASLAARPRRRRTAVPA